MLLLDAKTMDFHDSILKGGTAKELIKVLLEKSGYIVYPYGYECTFSGLRKKLFRNTKNSRTVRRIRSSPDLLVYDKNNKDVHLVEIKMRSNIKAYINQPQMESYREFWNDSLIVLIVPTGNVFYAQKISELEIKQNYYPENDFLKIQELFLRINYDDVLYYGGKAKNALFGAKDSQLNFYMPNNVENKQAYRY